MQLLNSDLEKSSQLNESILRFYKDRFRILLIIYFFSEKTDNPEFPLLFYGEIKIQAIDFFIRNPDYLAFELLSIAESDSEQSKEIKTIVKSIYKTSEPTIRRLEMEKFFYGAYEDIDDIIAFLSSRGLLKYESKMRTNLRVAEKHYYITQKAEVLLQNAEKEIEAAGWYYRRCSIIKSFLGGTTGSEMKARQYQIGEYSNTTYKEKIDQIDDLVYEKFKEIYNESL
jgi:hypothetical protein